MPEPAPELLDDLPLFPLPRVVLLPHTLLPLHVFEPRYRALVARAVDDDLVFGIPTIQDGGSQSDDCPPIHPMMGLGRIVRRQRLADGRSNIVVLGVGRARLVEELSGSEVPYRRARCQRLDDICTPTTTDPHSLRQVDQLRLTAMQVVHGRSDVTEELERLLSGDRDPSEVVDVLAHMCLRCADERLAYLELDSFRSRADHLLATLTTILYAKRSVAEG